MKLAKVIGHVVSTHKASNTAGLKFLVVRYLDETLKETARTHVCIDSVQANFGDIVLICASSSARYTKLTRNACTDSTIVGIVDVISSSKKDWYTGEKNLES
jgi:microcompartment protein CcmK/EutM